MKKILLNCALLLIVTAIQAQNETDALRYSFTQRPSTARSFGMGSSFGALGADLSSFFTNPAGVGFYKRPGIEFSLAVYNVDNTALYSGMEANNGNTRLSLNNFGIIGSKKPQNSDWVSFNFGIAYAKTNNFYDKITIRGNEFNTTLMDLFAHQAAGVAPANIYDQLPFTSALAYDVYAINPSDTLGTYYVPAASGGEVMQTKIITRTGSQNETSFSFAGNYKDILTIGGSIQFNGVRFTENGVYKEEFDEDESLKDLTYTDNLGSDGTGVGLKVGFIIKPIEWVRLGLAYHTRTIISMRENYTSSMKSNMASGENYESSSPTLITTYNLRTPARLLANVAFVVGKAGVIAADYEYTDYDNMKMRGTSTNPYDYEVENSTITQIYRGTHRLSAGMEWRILKEFYLRGGAIYQQSPFVNGVAINNPWITYTGGIGYKNDYFFADLSAGYQSKESTYYMYKTQETQPATIRSNAFTTMVSIGVRY